MMQLFTILKIIQRIKCLTVEYNTLNNPYVAVKSEA